jgi:serine/threonine-protein kinase
MLWELVTGSRLFKRESDVKIMRAVSDCEVMPPSMKNPAVPATLDPIVLKALAQHRANRYQTMEAFALDLEEWLTASQHAASSTHLATFMRRQFAARLEHEGSKGPLWDVDPAATGFLPQPGASSSRPKTEHDSSTSIQSLAQVAQAVPPAVTSARPRAWRPAVGVMILVAVVGAVWAMTRSEPPTPMPTLAQTVAPTREPIAAPVSQTARVRVTSEPSGAKILDGETTIGTTPADLLLPRARAAVNLTVQLAGYEAETRGVDVAAAPNDTPVTLEYRLKALAPAPKTEKPKAAKPKPNIEVKAFE